jgi:hypothetical protein
MCWFGSTRWTRFLSWWISLRGQSDAGVFSNILNVRESYALGSHATAILACSEYCISEGIIVNRAVSICSDSRAALLGLKSYAVSSRVGLQCRDSVERDQVLLLVGPEPGLPLAPSSVRRREREWLLKSHCASWMLETACHQPRMWLKKPNPGLTRYLLRLPRSKLWILVGLITWHCPLNKHLHNMGLIDEPICITWVMEGEGRIGISSSMLLPKSDISKNAQIFENDSERWRIWGGVCTAAICAGKWQNHCDSLIRSILWTFLLFVLSDSICLSICLFLIFQFFICVVHIRPDLWPACGDLISSTFNPSIQAGTMKRVRPYNVRIEKLRVTTAATTVKNLNSTKNSPTKNTIDLVSLTLRWRMLLKCQNVAVRPI